MKKQKLEGVLAPVFLTVNSLRPVYGQKLGKMEIPLSTEHCEIQQTLEKIGSVSKNTFKCELHVKGGSWLTFSSTFKYKVLLRGRVSMIQAQVVFKIEADKLNTT